MNVNIQTHLSAENRINLGSYYTPQKYVRLAAEWLKQEGINSNWTIADLSCGYGAFFEMSQTLPDNRYIGNDIDEAAADAAKSSFDFAYIYKENVFADVCRNRYGIASDDRLAIVGNPPYNDVTSQINAGLKKSALAMDADVRTRDLGLSSLLVYAKLQADYVLVLHPLSYLIKKANFCAGRRFFGEYKIINHTVFSSSEFSGTSRISGFPIIMAFYKKTQDGGLSYDAIRRFRFNTVEGKTFCLADRDYIGDYIDKYPNAKRFAPEILFYTMRDVNALKRSRTFIKTRVTNAVDVDPKKLEYYCYVDCFKDLTDNVPYYMGNFDIPFDNASFDEIKDNVKQISFYKHQDIFRQCTRPPDEVFEKVRDYIQTVINK